MKKLLVSITSLIGGSGKTIITQCAATVINKYTDYKVCIIDVGPQKSVSALRKRELETINENLSLANEIKELEKEGKNIINIYETEPSNLDFIETKKVENDITFVDISSSFNEPYVKSLYNLIDYLYVPFFPDKLSFSSHLETLDVIKHMHEKGESVLKEYGVFFNRFTEKIDSKVFEKIKKDLEQFKIPILKPVYENVKYQREWYSTIRTVPYNPSEKSIHSFVKSLLEHLGLKINFNHE